MPTATRKQSTRKKSSSAEWGGIRSEAVQKATGCGWDKWIKALDHEGCASMSHTEIAALVHAKWPKVGDWWSQMVTVGYEQARGLRANCWIACELCLACSTRRWPTVRRDRLG